MMSLVTLPLAFAAISGGWGPDIWRAELASQYTEVHTHLMYHLLAHLSLLHGIFPDNILNQSEYIFLGPAWSLSLEWQFYLVAPFIVAGLRSPAARYVTVGMILAAALAYRAGWFGRFPQPSMLAGAGLLFLVGIASRLCFNRLPVLQRYPWVSAALLLTLGVFSLKIMPIAIWAVVLAYLRLAPQAQDVGARIASICLGSNLAIGMGGRSYPVYLLHSPVLIFLMFAINEAPRMPPVVTFVISAVAGIVLTALGAEIIHRTVEKRGIDLGRRIRDRIDENWPPSSPHHEKNSSKVVVALLK